MADPDVPSVDRGAAMFSFGGGVFFGYYQARSVRLDPIELCGTSEHSGGPCFLTYTQDDKPRGSSSGVVIASGLFVALRLNRDGQVQHFTGEGGTRATF